MKILFISSGNNKVGISPIVFNQGESLKQQGIDIDYFTIKGKGLWGYIKNIPKIRYALNKENYDIIHAHYGLCSIVSQIAKKKEKLVVSFMGDDLIGSVGSNGKYTILGNILVFLNRLFIPKYDYVIVKSKFLAKNLNNKNYAIIPNGVNMNAFFEINKEKARKAINANPNKKILIFVANPNRPEKNFFLAKESVDLLKFENIELRSVYSVDQEKLKYYYSAADVLLQTSFHEGSPNVIKEAMACNCPIVSTDVGDVKWIIGHTEGCYIADSNPNDFSEKIKLALDFASKKGRTKGRDRIIELGLDSDTIAKKIIDIYKYVLKK
ncbi:MAG: glycosyltransferase family 4 protein [Marinilabiliales bacterium]